MLHYCFRDKDELLARWFVATLDGVMLLYLVDRDAERDRRPR